VAYATTTDVEDALGRSLTETEEAQVTGWLDDAGYLIDGWTRTASTTDTEARYLRVSVRMVVRALGAAAQAGVESGTEQVGPFARSLRYTADASSGDVWLSAGDKLILGDARLGSGMTSVQLGTDRYIEPVVEDDES
jgi:hypothetical protein